MIDRAKHQDNRLSWNQATEAHNSHKGDQVSFHREGGNALFPEEMALLGDIAGQSVVHLQCNSGQDTLSLAQLGAKVTGVDISDTAIEFAQSLSAASGMPATFERADVYDWLDEAAARSAHFDVVFSSYGALVWLSELQSWAQGIERILRPGGRLVLVDYHPVHNMFDEHLERVYPYSTAGVPLTFDGVGDYVAATGATVTGFQEGIVAFENTNRDHEWLWGLGEIVTAIVDSGLDLRALREYPWANGWKMYDVMVEAPGRRWVFPEGMPTMPLMYGLLSVKPA
jgi:SAM-dependent methyltransferase